MKRLQQKKAWDLDACIKCSACTAQCPVASVLPSFPGPKAIGPDAERLRLEGVKFQDVCLDNCTGCRVCEVTCPSGVNITEIITEAKKAMGKKSKGALALRNWLLGRAEYLGRMGTLFPDLTNRLLGFSPVRGLMEKLLGISKKAPLPSYGKKFSHQSNKAADKIAVYFPGCFTTYNDYLTGKAAAAVLEHNGYQVIVPDFKCCGVPLEANGHFLEAEKNARYNLELLVPFLEQGFPVIASCPSCSLVLKEKYPMAGTPGADRIGSQTYDLFEFLWELYEKGDLCTDFKNVKQRFGYHSPCHLKVQGIGSPSVRLLKMLPGTEVDDINGGCCGLSGSYGFKAENFQTSVNIGSSLFQLIKARKKDNDLEAILSECGGCRMQIEQGTKMTTQHPALILEKSYKLKG